MSLRFSNTVGIGLAHRRSADLSGDPFAGSKLDYAYNLLAAGILKPEEHDASRMDLAARLVRARRPIRGSQPNTGDAAKRALTRKLIALAAQNRERRRVPALPNAPVLQNLRLLASLVGLDDPEAAILTFALACRDRDMRDLLAPIECESLRALATLVAAATAQPMATVEKVLASQTRLLATGLLQYRSIGDVEDRLEIDHRLVDVLPRECLGASELLERFLPAARSPTLSLTDFQHLEPAVDLARRILAATLVAKRPGINTLIVGATGTGKSELARLLAALLSVPLFVAGREDGEGESPTARERLTSLLLGNRILAGSQGLLLFDEMEDLFDASLSLLQGKHHDGPRMSKQWFNHLLETNQVPTIWISNDVRGVDPAFLRRFSYIIEIPAFTSSQRHRAWTRHLGSGNTVSPDDVEALAQNFAVSPAEIGSAVTATRLALGGSVDRATLEAVLQPADKILRGRTSRHAASVSANYDPALVNTPVDLERLADRLSTWRQSDGPGVSLCLYGPSGTGKSAYVRHLAQRLRRPLVVRRASDLLGSFLGESERNIASAFEEAQDDGAVLLFDEADSFLRDRRSARHSWEITQTNEFLQQLEVFPGIVAATTNLFDHLDQASLRRFAFKVPFLYLTPEAARGLFHRALKAMGAEEEPSSAVDRHLAGMSNLTPGDFAAVLRRLKSLDGLPTPSTLLEELRSEISVKEAAPRRIGFDC